MIAAYSPEARGRSERAFGTHQGRLPQELALAGITDMEAANRYLQEVYLPVFNVEFSQPAPEEGSAFVPWIGGHLDDTLCEQYKRTVSADNCVRFETLILQIPADRHRCHYIIEPLAKLISKWSAMTSDARISASKWLRSPCLRQSFCFTAFPCS